ncbi:MAG TPA: Na/Pi symporter [Bacteroidia bacterium]|nr:Na/Pi symporter [Bacteroidia bacterium]
MEELFQFAAGLGIFIYAMHLLEDSLKNLAGRTFKLFLRKHTSNTVEAISSSALVTGILQSSSVVILMTLAFLGAGIMTMRNALAVAIGSNFGTTLDSWLVATLGFKVDIALFAFPMIGVAAIAIAFLAEGKKIYHAARFILGFGFLFMGLDFMKEGIEALLKDFDFREYEGYHSIVFVLCGFVITALIQSSSAMVAIILSALHTGAIPFETGVAVMIGAEFGNSVKILIGSFGSNPAKWQLGVGNTFFNFTITVLAYVFMGPLIEFTGFVFSEKEILLRLVLFQSAMNLAGVLLFAPFLDMLARFLEKHIAGKENRATFVITSEMMKIPGASLDALEEDTEILLYRVLPLNMEAFATQKKMIHVPPEIRGAIVERNRKLKTYDEKYDDIKRSEGELLVYSLNAIEYIPAEHKRIDELVSCIRHAMHSAKALKDVMHNRIDFRESADDIKYSQYTHFRQQLEKYYHNIDTLLKSDQKLREDQFNNLLSLAHEQYFDRQKEIYDAARKEKMAEEDISSLLNVNRELYTSCKTIVQALHLFYEGTSDSGKIGDLP